MSGGGFAGAAAIVGIGATEFSRKSGRSELQLALEAIRAALADAGLRPADVDGLVSATSSTTPENQIAGALGVKQLTFFARTPFGGGGSCATLLQAALAVASRAAEVVVCFRALNQASGVNQPSRGAGMGAGATAATADNAQWSWYAPFGMTLPAAYAAMFARRYMHVYGATSRDFGQVTVRARDYAATNPRAYFHGRPVTIDDHQRSRLVADPLRLLDCCLESDGAVALVVTRRERAADLRQPAVIVKAAAQGAHRDQHVFASFYEGTLTDLPELAIVASQLWAQSGLTSADIQCAILYDHFTPLVLYQLEELGFCGRGEGAAFVAAETDIAGRLPVNPNGGQIGEGYIQGMNGIAEAVRQVRGTAANQIAAVEHVLVTAGTTIPTSGLVLGRG